MSSLTLAQLRVPETQATIETRLLAALAARLPAGTLNAWIPPEQGGVERTVVRMVSGTLSKLVSDRLARAVTMRFLDSATGVDLDFLALHFYGLVRNGPTKTVQSVKLSAMPTAPENDLAAGELWVASVNGHRYVSLDPLTLAPNRHQTIRVEAEFAGSAYDDAEGEITVMVSALGGVSCTNVRASDYLTRLTGTSTGHVEVHGQDDDGIAPPVNQVVRVRIDASGDVGSGAFSFKLGEDGDWTPGGPITPVFFAPNEETWFIAGNRIIFTDGNVSPNFIAGDVYTSLAASPILQQGSDGWSDALLRKLCRTKWSTLSDVPTGDAITLLAFLGSPEVAKAQVDADPEVPGATIVTLASSAGPATAQAQFDVADFIEARLLGYKGIGAPLSGIAGSPEEVVSVRSAAALPITPAGTVDVPRAKLASAQQASDLAWLAYLASVGIGGVVILAKLEELLLDAGAITFLNVTLNGQNRNVELGANEAAVPAPETSLSKSLIWRPR